MTIYTRFGSPVKIIAYVGEDTGQSLMYGEVRGEWVRVRYQDDGRERDVMVNDLRADNNWTEIHMAILVADAPYEPDGTRNEFSVEWRLRCEPDEDWLEKWFTLKRERRCSFTLKPHEGQAAWHAAVLNMQGRWADADDEYWTTLRREAAYENDPSLRVVAAVAEARLQSAVNRAEPDARYIKV